MTQDFLSKQKKGESPCIQICQMNQETGWCTGCFRTLDEIAMWGDATFEEKQRIWNFIYQRQLSGPNL